MNYKDEGEIKQALGIESWRNLSKDKMIKFALMMPDMDSEVALKVVEQFPVFKEFAMDAVGAMEKAHNSTLLANKQSQKQVHRAYRDIREILKGELRKDDLSLEERKHILELIMDTGRQQAQKDSENKQFLDALAKRLAQFSTAALVLGAVFVGGRLMGESKNSPGGS